MEDERWKMKDVRWIKDIRCITEDGRWKIEDERLNMENWIWTMQDERQKMDYGLSRMEDETKYEDVQWEKCLKKMFLFEIWIME